MFVIVALIVTVIGFVIVTVTVIDIAAVIAIVAAD